MRNKENKGKGQALKIIVAIALVAVIALVVVGSQGEWFQGMLRGMRVTKTSRTLDTRYLEISGDVRTEIPPSDELCEEIKYYRRLYGIAEFSQWMQNRVPQITQDEAEYCVWRHSSH